MAGLKQILVARGEVQRIAALFEVSDQTIRNALKFITEGEEPDRYRKEAIKGGGKITGRPIKLPTKA